MIELKPSQVTPALRSLFDPQAPTGLRCFTVLNGGNHGRIFTDDPENPRWGCVWEADDGTLYRGGLQNKDILSHIVSTLRQDGLVALGFRDGDPSTSLFPQDPEAGATCLEFDRPIGGSDLTPYLKELPSGFEIQRMDRMILEKSSRFDEKMNRYGSIDNFLDKGLGICVVWDGEIVCETYADMEVMGIRELGVFTHKAYWGRGFATITCAHLIKLCEEMGCQTYWDCVKLNLGSAVVARKLGFRNEREYRLLAWFPRKR